MALRLDIRSNIKDVTRQLAVRDPKLIRRATVSGLNAGMTVTVRQTLKRSSANIGIAQKFIRQRTKRTRASARRLEAITTFNPRGLNPLKIGMSPAAAERYYKAPRVGRAFVMRMPNGSQQVVVRKPASRNPSPAKTAQGARRKGRLPVQSIRIFIGRETIKQFNETLNREGYAEFERKFTEYLRQRL